ncbi:DMT family transporter [Paraflavitalea speifideaquila]|uniref:DMT family transporter n=1 Tax=Paraflavitalea speifideaquila TaxID=3076558 RepID=UPI003312FA4D
MKSFFYILPILAGVAMTVQSGINAQLRAAISHPILAAFISFFGWHHRTGGDVVVFQTSFPCFIGLQ